MGGGSFIARSLILLLMVLGVPDSFAQSENIPVSFTLEAPQPTCGVTKLKDINFGVLGRPAPGGSRYESVMLDERFEGDRILVGREVTDIDGSTRTIGKLKITASNVTKLMLMWGFPEKLVAEGGHEIVYDSNFYAHSRNEDGPNWERLHWDPRLTLPYDGVEPHGTHYFQIGGRILIYPDTPPGRYTGTMTLSVSCPE